MAKSVKALINHKVLVWARKSSGLTIDAAAKKLGQKPETLKLWESDDGDKLPTFKQLIKISQTYKRPVSLFYLEQPPKDFKPLNDYRRLPDLAPLDESPQLNYEIRKAYYRRQVAIELFEELDETPPKFSHKISLSDNPEVLAEKIRSWVNIDNITQTKWKSDNEAFNAWRQALESLGILVFQTGGVDSPKGVEVSEMRGFAISDRPLPVIVVNRKDSLKGRIFSMLHEFAHILLGDSSVSGDAINEKGLKPEEKHIEVFCNHVAAAALLPSDWFKKDELLSQFSSSKKWDDEAVYAAAQRFNVSREFIWRRLLTLNSVNQATYKAKRHELIKEFMARKELEEKAGKKSIIVPTHRRIISSIGKFYAELVLSSYHQDKINSSAVSDYLGMKLKHLPKIEGAIFEGAK